MEISYDLILQYLLSKKYPEGASNNHKRSIRKKCKKFVLKDGLVCYSSEGVLKQWIYSDEQQKRVIALCHADRLGGHLGRDKTRQKIVSRNKS